MIKFYDPSGASHFGQASITRTTSVNGGLSLTGEVFDGDDVLNGLDYGWWLNFDNEKYVITYKKLSDDTNTIVFDAVQQFFWDFAKVALHSQYTGSHEYAFYLNQLFNGSGYTYKNDVSVPAFEKENWGYKNKLSLFNDIMDQADVEFEVHNETVHIAKQIGSDLTSFVRKGINLSDLTEEIKISDFATYAKGYGAFKDPQDPSKGRLEVEYRSELADKFGVLEMDPIVDERYTIANNLISKLKKKIDATYTVSMTMNIYDLESAGYPNYESPKVGDWILAIDEALNFKRKIRIIKLEEQFDVTGKRIGYTATCGDLSIVDQYTNLQGSLDSKVQRIQESIDSVAASANEKNSNYYGAKEPVKANEGDLWFDQSNSDPDKWTIKQWLNGRWEQITLNPGEISDKVNAVKAEAESASEKAEQVAAKYDDTNSLASQALDRATSAQSEAGSAIAKAESTASEFGKVSQKADSAFDNAMNAQSAASNAATQASSAAADSKDAKQIAGAVSQSYKTLTDGSTMTIAELESGLAVKLTKTDLNGYATQTWAQNQINTTAKGINATVSSIKTTVDGHTTSINDLKADSHSFKSQFTTVNNTIGKHTTDIGKLQASAKSLSANFDSLSSDNQTNQHNISQLQASAETFNSTLMTVQTQYNGIGQSQGRNYVRNSQFDSHMDNWYVTAGDGILTIDTTRASQTNLGKMGLHIYGTTTDNFQGVGQSIPLKMTKGQKFVIGMLQSFDGEPSSGNLHIGVHYRDSNGTILSQEWHDLNCDAGWSNVYGRNSFVYTAADDCSSVNLMIYAPGPNYHFNAYITEVSLTVGPTSFGWQAAPEDLATVTAVSSISQTIDHIQTTVSSKVDNETYQSKINQLSDQINLRVESKGVINAVNVSKEGIQIYGDKLHITATTFIDDATIKDAMIESLDATKIKVGTLDATKVNIVNLNATNITTGIINGSNLSLNLNTGVVTFQRGRIHNASNTIDINIDAGYMSVANGRNRVMLKNGEMQFVEPGTYDTSTNPYLRISNTFGGQSTEGAAFIGRKYAALTNSDNATGNGMFDVGLGTEKFSGFATGYGSGLLNQGWHATKVGGADRGVIISGGKEATYRTYATASPSITVGASGGTAGSSRGTNIVLDCNYLYNYSTWVQTSSHAANVYVADDGAIVRASSASKYKTNIERSFETEMGERILEVPTAHWLDKAEVRNKALNPQAPDPRRYFGMIADDLDDAGLTELVEYNENGEVEGLMYDRIALTLIPLIRNYRDRITELETKVKETKEA